MTPSTVSSALHVLLITNCCSGFLLQLFSIFFFLAREATIQKIETIIKEQFSLEMKNKEHEIDVISQVFKLLIKLFKANKQK